MAQGGNNQTLSERIQALCAQLSADLNSGKPARIEDLLDGWQGDERSELLRQLLNVEIKFRRAQQEDLSVDEFVDRFPDDTTLVNLVFERSSMPIDETLVYSGSTAPWDFGEYTVLDKIGEGGMGAVYKARHKRMKRTVAIKLLPRQALDSPDAVKRFEREVEVAAKLEHPNVVTAYDAGEAHGHHFLVMRYVDGQDLSAHVKQHGPLSVETTINYIAQAAQGLEYAHGEGIIHRDIKPSNLLLNRKGTVKILDLGLARLDSETDDNSVTELTQSGTAMGTVDYMAPEQSADAHTADVRSDIYSLGCTLYYLLTARSVYGGATLFNRMLAHRDQPIPALTEIRPDIPPAVNDLFSKMVAKQPEDRYQSMTEVIKALSACGVGTLPEPVGTASGSSFPAEPSSPATIDGLAPTTTHVQPATAESTTSETSISAVNQQTVITQGGSQAEQTRPNRNRVVLAAIGSLAFLLIGALIWFNRPFGTEQSKTGPTDLVGSGKDQTPAIVLPEDRHAAEVSQNDYALQFDGKDDYVSIESWPEFNPNESLTIDAYAMLQSPSEGVVVSRKAGISLICRAPIHQKLPSGEYAAPSDAPELNWMAEYIAPNYEGQLYSYNLPPNQLPKTRQRSHLAAIWNHELERITFYVNGKLVKSINQAISNRKKPPESLYLGVNFPDHSPRWENEFFHGTIDEVRISNVARYDKNFTPQKRFEPDEHTLALYHFDEGEGEILKDSSGNGHHGKIVGAKWVKVDGSPIGRTSDHDIPQSAAANSLPGIIPRPATLPGIRRWQVILQKPTGGNAVWSPDGKWIAVNDGMRIRLYDGKSWQLKRVLAGHQRTYSVWNVETVKWSPNSRWLASAYRGSPSSTPEMKLWNVADDKSGPTFKAGAIPATAFVWSKDGKRLVSATGPGDPHLRVWDLDGELKKTIPIKYADSSFLDWISDGKQLAAIGPSMGQIAIVNLVDGQTTLSPFEAHNTFSLSPDGKHIAVGARKMTDDDPLIQVVDVATKEVIASMGTGVPLWANNVVWSPDGNLIAVPGQNANVWVFDWRKSALHWRGYVRAPAHNASWNPTGEILATADAGGNTKIWQVGGDVYTPKQVIPGFLGHRVTAFARSRTSGSSALVTTHHRLPRMLDVNGKPQAVLHSADQEIQSVAWHPTDNRLATGDLKGRIQFWNQNGELEQSLTGHTGKVLAVAWSPDGELFAASGPDKLRLWNKNGTLQTTVETPTAMTLLQWQPHGKLLAGIGNDKHVFIWNSKGELKQTLEGHGARIRTLAWRPDGSRLATGGEDGTARQWSLDDQGALAELDQFLIKPGDSKVIAIAWSPGGERLATSGEKRQLQFWSAAGKQQQSIDVSSFEIPVGLYHIDWTQDDNRLLTVSGTGRIHQWDLAKGQPTRVSAILPDGHVATFDANGKMLSTTQGAEQELIYLIEREKNRSLEVLTPVEFFEATKTK